MATAANLQSDFTAVVNDYGVVVNVQLKSIAVGSDYDSATLSNSGTLVGGSVFILPVGRDDRQFLEQGVIKASDLKLFAPSGLQFSENADVVVSGGAQAGSYYVVSWTDYALNGTLVYRKAFIRTARA